MRCIKCKKLLVEFLDGRLDDRQDREIRDHLSECVTCMDEMECLQSSLKLIKTVDSLKKIPSPPSDFERQVINRIHEYIRVYHALPRKLALGAAVICCILAITFGFLEKSRMSMDVNVAVVEPMSESTKKVILPKPMPGRKTDRSKPASPESAIIKREASDGTKVSTVQPEKTLNTNETPLYQIKTHISLELAELLEQTLEVIKEGEQQWEIEI